MVKKKENKEVHYVNLPSSWVGERANGTSWWCARGFVPVARFSFLFFVFCAVRCGVVLWNGVDDEKGKDKFGTNVLYRYSNPPVDGVIPHR